MSRRTASEEREFGSDSFLDIIANIVGILIILIVVAGVKVARQPPESALTQVEVSSQPDDVPNAEQIASTTATTKEVGPEFTIEQIRAMEAEINSDVQVVQQLENDIGTLRKKSLESQQQLVGLVESAGRLKERLDTRKRLATSRDGQWQVVTANSLDIQNRVRSLEAETRLDEERLLKASRSIRVNRDRQREAAGQLDGIQVQTQLLQELLDEKKATAAGDVDRIHHRISPVVRGAIDHELHFRLSGGRIAWVPLEPLLKRLKQQLGNRLAIVRQFGKYKGVCGPVNGFLMKYEVARQAPSPIPAFNGPARSVRIAVSRWAISPADTLTAESVDEALRIGSRFRQLVEASSPDTTITVWLYADDFAHFQPLREYAHGLGLRVAARPLPDGAEITGSPGGSRSSAQ